MRMIDLIQKKKDGIALKTEEIKFIIEGFTKNEIPDYQMSAFLMAVCFNGMTKKETSDLTLAMANSGDMVDLSEIPGIKVDKHSTGGVGDKTTLIISPIVASLGVYVAKMSGRGLGHTGGTVDKLESIPGLQTAFSKEKFLKIVSEVGVCVAGQSGNLAPADKKIYALRDVTSTVNSIPLIASSIMSKKIAAGSDAILLDVKTGSGAFMKTLDEAVALAAAMVDIGESVGRRTVAMITDMDIPLGYAIGNSLEIKEVIETLKGRGPKDLTDVCIDLAAEMLALANKGSFETCRAMVKDCIEQGAALDKLAQMVAAQGGNADYIKDPLLFKEAKVAYEIVSQKSGYIAEMDVEGCGIASCLLGAGRDTEASLIDYSAGILLKKKTGDKIEKGDVLAVLYADSKEKCLQGEEKLINSLVFKDKAPQTNPLVYARVDKAGVIKYV